MQNLTESMSRMVFIFSGLFLTGVGLSLLLPEFSEMLGSIADQWYRLLVGLEQEVGRLN